VFDVSTPLKMSHLFGGIVGGIAFGLVSGLLLGSCVFEAGPNHMSASGVAPRPSAPSAETEGGAPVPGGMDPGAGTMEMVFAKVGELKKRVDSNPGDREALVDLANLYYDANKFDQASAYYERALAIDRNDPNILTDAANSYWLSGKPSRARDLLRETRAKFPAHWQSAANLFFLAASEQDPSLAGEALEEVKRLKPDFEKLPQMEKIYEDLNRGGRGGAPVRGQ
jgi:hypothetical protein